MDEVYKICIPNSFRDSYDYTAEGFNPCIGARVWVPFRNKTKLGIVIAKGDPEIRELTLKNIEEVIDDQPLIDENLLALCQWVANYYQSPLSEVLPLAFPKKYRQGQAVQLPMGDYYQLIKPLNEACQHISKQARKQLALLEFLAGQNEPVSKQLLTQQGYTSTQILALVDAEIIGLSQQIQLPMYPRTPSAPLHLNPEQAIAVAEISQHLHHFRSLLLQGVTGSGKTEVYLQVIDQLLKQNKQVLIIVPEIGLTPQLVDRFAARFAQPIGVIHSNLNETERQTTWQLAKDNHINIVIGTRSSVFTPMPNLGLIIIDEEHDQSLKQMEGVRYSARDTALMRAHLANIPIVLGSATPSLESLHNCKQQKHQLLRLNHKAMTDRPLHYQLIDLRSQVLQHGLASPTLKTIQQHLDQHNQVLVFINRRGFAPVLLCHDCGTMVDCKACDSHLTVHKQLGQMHCHHCGFTQKIPLHCPKCSSKELIPVGAGTQRIHEFLSKQFPDTSVLRIDRDEVRKKDEFSKHLNAIHQGDAQLIVGTQMLAKGHHFPRLSLVVILEADAGLFNQDFRALEQLGQLLTQVAGRAGRAEHPGQVIIQTHVPDHPLLNLLIKQGYDHFAEALLNTRQQSELPPFHYLALIRAQAKSPQQVLQFLHTAKEKIEHQSISVFGPAPAPLFRKANQHRMQLLVKSSSRKALKSTLTDLREWLTINKLHTNIRWNVDVDPMDLS